jgi:hypothetical protein
MLHTMEQASLPQPVRCEYNERGPFCSSSSSNTPIFTKERSICAACVHLNQATPLFQLSRALRRVFALDQTTDDLLCSGLWWLLGTSVRESDGLAPDCFLFLGAVTFTDVKTTRAFLVSTCIMQSIRCSSSHSAEGDRKVLSSTPRIRWHSEPTFRSLMKRFCRFFHRVDRAKSGRVDAWAANVKSTTACRTPSEHAGAQCPQNTERSSAWWDDLSVG